MNILTNKLVNRKYEWTYTTGMTGSVVFTEDLANWEILEGPNKGSSDSNKYKAREVDEDIYFVQWHEANNKITVTLLINEKLKKVYSSVASADELEFESGDIHKIE